MRHYLYKKILKYKNFNNYKIISKKMNKIIKFKFKIQKIKLVNMKISKMTF